MLSTRYEKDGKAVLPNRTNRRRRHILLLLRIKGAQLIRLESLTVIPLLPRAGQINPLSGPLVEKKSCATREKHLFSLVAQCTIGYFKRPKRARSSGVVYFAQKVFFKIKGCLSVIGVVCSKLIFGYFKSPKISRNSGIVSFLNFKVFI